MIKIPLHAVSDPHEKLFIKTINEYIHKADLQNRPFFTDFYNKSWMVQTLEKYIGKGQLVHCQFFGGHEEAERQILGFCPYAITESDLPIGCLQIFVKTGIGKPLCHRDFLGALLGLGIERDAIGDLILKPFGAYVIMKKNMMDYVRISLTGIGRYQNIEVEEVGFESLEIEEPKIKTLSVTVASLRLDAILAAGFGISRSNAVKLIQADKAKCNGMSVTASYILKEGDSVTLRGYGKIKIGPMGGLTKKDRLRIMIEKYI